MGCASLASSVFLVAFPFFLLSPFALYYAEEVNRPITYPLSDATHPDCSLSTIIYCKDEKSMINSSVGTPYEVKSIDERDNTIVIYDVKFSESLQGCGNHNNFSVPNFPPLLFEVNTPNFTFLECKKHVVLPPEFSVGFYPNCNDYNLFYSSDLEQNRQQAHSYTPDDCSVFYFPLKPPDGNLRDSHLFTLLEEGFSLRWINPQDCHDDCEATCLSGWNGALKRCAGNKKLLRTILGAGIGALVGGILLLALIFFYCRRRWPNGFFFGSTKAKNHSPSSTPLSVNTNFNSTSQMDLEKGGITYFGVHVFSYDELVEATNNFDSSRELGDGGFGIVYHGKLRDGRVVAVKRLYENTFKHVKQFMNEVEILTQLRHQNLVTLYGCTSRHSRELLLVYEYIPNGTVADHLHGDRAEPGSLAWPIRMSIAIETASALSYLHASDIIHRDVKTNNILLDNNFCVKVADFGLSRLFPLDVTHVSTAPQGTPGYVDPEYHDCYQLTTKSDVYSFGVVLIELISSMPAVDINRHRHEINLADLATNKIQDGAFHELIDSCLGFESDHGVRMMTTLVAELAFRCLQLDKEMRPSMDEVLKVLRGIESEHYQTEKAEVCKEVRVDASIID